MTHDAIKPFVAPKLRRLAGIVALVGVAFVGTRMVGAWPRDVEIRYEFDPEAVRRLHVDYTLEGDAMVSARFRTTDSDRGMLGHTVRLPPGRYDAEITVYDASGKGTSHTRVLAVPPDGEVRFDLRP